MKTVKRHKKCSVNGKTVTEHFSIVEQQSPARGEIRSQSPEHII